LVETGGENSYRVEKARLRKDRGPRENTRWARSATDWQRMASSFVGPLREGRGGFNFCSDGGKEGLEQCGRDGKVVGAGETTFERSGAAGRVSSKGGQVR